MILLYRLRAARIDDFVSTLREVHKEFQWPFPLVNEQSDTHTLSPASTIRGQSPKDTTNNSSPVTPVKNLDTTLTTSEGGVPIINSTNETVTSLLKRANRPPDLDLTPAHTVAILRTNSQGTQQYSINLDTARGNPSVKGQSPAGGSRSDFDPMRSSTPSRRSGSISERVSLVMKPNACEFDLLSVS